MRPSGKLHAAIACLLNERVRALSHDLPKGHTLQMRRMDFGDAAPHTFFVDYLYDASVLPLYTQRELIRHLSTELCTQTFAPQIRYLEEHWDQAPRKEEPDPYDSPDHLPQERTPICFRQDFYVADIKRIFYNRFRGDHFYQIDGLLPTSLLKEEPVSGENHWLADWDQKEARARWATRSDSRFTKYTTLKTTLIRRTPETSHFPNWKWYLTALNMRCEKWAI